MEGVVRCASLSSFVVVLVISLPIEAAMRANSLLDCLPQGPGFVASAEHPVMGQLELGF